MRTDEEILSQIENLNHNDDFFGVIRGDLISYLPYDAAKPYLKEDVAAEDWKADDRSRAGVIATIADYMPFAWEKANGCRGLSASRSLDHMQAWLFMLGCSTEECDKLKNYNFYGKPWLRAICDELALDWRRWDDGDWRNSEMDDGVSPESVFERTIDLPCESNTL